MPTKHEITDSIAKIAKKLGRAPTQKEFNSLSSTSVHYALQHFRTWNAAVKAAGVPPYALNTKHDDHALLEDWGKAVRRHRRVPVRSLYEREGEFNASTLEKRFGSWSGLSEVFRKFARTKPEWRDVLDILSTQSSPNRPQPQTPQRPNGGSGSTSSLPQREPRHAPRKGGLTYGTPTRFRWLRHEPLNEQGVVLLFGLLAKSLGYIVDHVQTSFPDCEALRQIAPGRWQRVRIEFELESKNFRAHRHSETGCDMIVCWRHNWLECPKQIEVLELSRIIQPRSLRKDCLPSSP